MQNIGETNCQVYPIFYTGLLLFGYNFWLVLRNYSVLFEYCDFAKLVIISQTLRQFKL